uniref:Uncharacterized protein n=1 Tax=Avena sativa TaxID=4498 RepID=A0ACD5XMW1_AVESA
MEALVCASHRAIVSLLRKLGDLLSDEYKLLTRVKRDIMFLKAELESMHAFLKKMSEVDDPDELSKCSIKEVRELSYDIEDGIDNFMLSFGVDSSYKPRGFKGLAGRCMDLLTNSKTRHWVVKKIKVLKHGAMEASSRRARYKIDDGVSRLSRTSIDPRLPAFFTEMTRLVGIEGPRDKLIKLLTEGEGTLVHQLKVVSIVGFGGLGKTTLANQVYQKLEGKFECQAFVSVSQTPNLKKILRNILFQICGQEHVSNEACDEQQLISTIRQFLKDKRYFIVIDNIWSTSAWRAIKLDEETLQILGDLPSLSFLWLTSRTARPKQRLIVSSSGFLFLKEFYFTCWESGRGLMVEAGAMPELEKFRVPFNAHGVFSSRGDLDFGIENLTSLKHLHVEIVCFGAKVREVEALEDAVKNAAGCLSDDLTLEMSRWDEEEIVKDGDHEFFLTEYGDHKLTEAE